MRAAMGGMRAVLHRIHDRNALRCGLSEALVGFRRGFALPMRIVHVHISACVYPYMGNMRSIAGVLYDFLRYIFLQEIHFVRKILLGLIMLLLFYLTLCYSPETLKEFMKTYDEQYYMENYMDTTYE